VDMRLRPSGRKGPVAVSLQSFTRYQGSEAWVWEHMALTRARVICGDPELTSEIEAVIRSSLDARKGRPEVMKEAREMRQRLADARAVQTKGVWELKEAPGGLMDIEFLAQTGVLETGIAIGRRAVDSLPALADSGWITQEETTQLVSTLALLTSLQQIERVALEMALGPASLGHGLSKRLTKIAGVDSIDDLSEHLASSKDRAAEIVDARFELR
ncbi:MAG: glutamine-synthetase adenylyltransferase, partial [Pseudomonadota bacterium]